MKIEISPDIFHSLRMNTV